MRMLFALLAVGTCSAQGAFAQFFGHNYDSYAAMVLAEPGLVSHWRHGESSGNLVDAKGGFTGTVAGTVTYSQTGGVIGDANTAIAYNGSSGTAQLSTGESSFDFEHSSPFTLEVIIKPNVTRSGGNAEYTMFGKMEGSGTFRGFSWYLNWTGTITRQCVFMISDFGGGTYLKVCGSTDIANTHFQHLVVTYNGNHLASGVKFYSNGLLETNSVDTNSLGANTILNNISPCIASRCNSIQFLPATIDELAVYNVEKPRSMAERHFLRRALRPSPTSSIPNVIIDTDIADDIDDVDAIYIGLRLQQMGYYRLIGVITTTDLESSPQCAQVLMHYAGSGLVPMGALQGAGPPTATTDSHCPDTIANFNDEPTNDRADYEAAATAYRRMLAAAPDASVVIMAMGFSRNLQALLQSTSDGIDSRNGVNLVTAKVTQLYFVAGIYPSGTEFNFSEDASAGNYVATNWPTAVPIRFIGIELGDTILINGGNAAIPVTNPLRVAHDEYGNASRQAWGTLGMLAAAAPTLSDYFSAGGSNGKNTVNSSTGANSWASTPNVGHSYYTKAQPDGFYVNFFNFLMMGPDVAPRRPAVAVAF